MEDEVVPLTKENELAKIVNDLKAQLDITKLALDRANKLIQLKTLQITTMGQFYQAGEQARELEAK